MRAPGRPHAKPANASQLLPRLQDQQLVRCADRLRYEWFTGDLVEHQATDVIDAQHQRLTIAWYAAWTRTPDRPGTSTLSKQQSLTDLMGSQYALSTRYMRCCWKNTCPPGCARAPRKA